MPRLVPKLDRQAEGARRWAGRAAMALDQEAAVFRLSVPYSLDCAAGRTSRMLPFRLSSETPLALRSLFSLRYASRADRGYLSISSARDASPNGGRVRRCWRENR